MEAVNPATAYEQKIHLLRAIQRSELAYSSYRQNTKYFQALRIYKANKIVYSLLEIFLLECNREDVEIICEYLFHLEDWFNQFDCEVQKGNIELSHNFIFERLEYSISFPKHFKTILL
ncbi:MAG: hypothetical protein QM564_12975 [Bergeyella sp.]